MSVDAADAVLLCQLFRRENPPLVRFLTRLTRCRFMAEDLAQLAWVKLMNARQRGICVTGLEGELRTYLFEVARNTFIDECTRKHATSRTRATDPADLADLLAGSERSASAEDVVLHHEARTALWRAVAALPAAQREVIMMWCSGESTDGMARRTGAPYDTVLSRKKYAFAHMRGSLACDA